MDLAPDKPKDIVARLAERGVRALYRLRLVTHLDVDRNDIERAIAILRATL